MSRPKRNHPPADGAQPERGNEMDRGGEEAAEGRPVKPQSNVRRGANKDGGNLHEDGKM